MMSPLVEYTAVRDEQEGMAEIIHGCLTSLHIVKMEARHLAASMSVVQETRDQWQQYHFEAATETSQINAELQCLAEHEHRLQQRAAALGQCVLAACRSLDVLNLPDYVVASALDIPVHQFLRLSSGRKHGAASRSMLNSESAEHLCATMPAVHSCLSQALKQKPLATCLQMHTAQNPS